MKKMIMILIFIFATANLFANDEDPAEATGNEKSVMVAPKIFLGAAAVIGATDPDFSYGLGVRVHYFLPDASYGLFADMEYNHRGGAWGESWDLNYIDFNFGVLLVKEAFLGAGLTVGFLLSQGEAAPDNMESTDFGGFITFGYIFSRFDQSNDPKFILGFDFKVSYVNVYEQYYGYDRKSITWGGFVGVGF